MSERQSFYVGIKGLIQDSAGDILILKDVSKGKWELPGGRIDTGQSIPESFSRELNEEIPGARLNAMGALVHAAQGDFLVENNHKLLLLFYKTEVTLPDTMRLSDEHSGYDWVNETNVNNFDIFSSDKAAILAILAV